MERPQDLKRRITQLQERNAATTAALREARVEIKRETAARRHAEGTLRTYREHVEELAQERTAQLLESERRYRALFDDVPVGLYRTTPAGQLVDVNRQFVEMMGYPSRKATLAVNAVSIWANASDRPRWQALLERDGVARGYETQLRKRDGTLIWVNNTASAVKDESGQVLYYEGSIEDITPRKRAEAELQKYQEHLEELVAERTSELRRSEERYRTLFDGVPVGLYRSTPDGRLLDANPAAAQMMGYPGRGEFLRVANPRQAYLDPADRQRWEELMERDGVVHDFEAQVRRYDGSVIWVNDSARSVKDQHSHILYYEGSLEDVTERKQFEEELRWQKDYFEALFVNSPVAVVTADRDAVVVTWNPMAERLFGHESAEAVGRRLDDLVANDPSLRAEAAQYSYQATNIGRVEATTRRTCKDGSLVDVDLLALPLNLAGESAGFITIYHDITQRKQFEEELRRQKEYFEALLVNSPVAVMTVDLDARVVSWNPTAEKLFGYTQAEAIGRNIDDLIATHPSIREEALRYTRQLTSEGRVQATTSRTRKDGSLVDVEVFAVPVLVAGRKLGYIGIFHDITELQQARRAAEAASQAKSAFLANMSHELRTPLNAILGFTQLMADDSNLTIEQRGNLGIINRSGEHLLALINDVLDMSKIEAGQVSLLERGFDLYDLLGGLEEMFRLRAEDKGLALTCERGGGVPRYVVTDEGKLRQVLSNLLGNAVKFTQHGRVTLRVNAAPAEGSIAASERVLHFEVEDTGPGMASEDLLLVFRPFVQTASGQQSREGTGLGLSICRSFVRLMHGEVAVSSVLGKGSLFEFDARVGLAEAAQVHSSRSQQAVLGLVPGQPVYRMLVAEDRETNRRLLVKVLEPFGFEVREAVDGREALEAWEQWNPHLIWMDMRMPVMDGHEVTRRIKGAPRGKSTVIVALTASAFEEDRERMLAEGCDDVVRKPFRKAEILDMLAKHLGIRFLYGDAAAPRAAQREASQELPTLSTLAGMPKDWSAELEAATVKADLGRILALIDEIRRASPVVAETLDSLARDFAYKRILSWLRKQEGPNVT
jgi:PAS domain S-box-containing protein